MRDLLLQAAGVIAAQPVAILTHIRDQAGTLDSTEYFDGFSKRIQLRSAAEGGQVLSDGSRRYNARSTVISRTAPMMAVMTIAKRTAARKLPVTGTSAAVRNAPTM